MTNIKKNILLVAGCNVSKTPVVKNYLLYLNSNDIKYCLVEYGNFQRFKFVFKSLYEVVFGKYSQIIFVNQQSLPVLVLTSWISKSQLVYWKLESYKILENYSLALNIQLLEYLLNRVNVNLVLPTVYRAEVQSPVFENYFVIPNAPLFPYITPEKINRIYESNKPAIVLYGNMKSPDEIFLDEWIIFSEKYNKNDLFIIGKTGNNLANTKYEGEYTHEHLINRLKNPGIYNFSIVGYKDTGQNTRLAAPNKLLESLACGLPVIGHIGNQYVVDIVSKYRCGLLIDFRNISSDIFELSEQDYKVLVDNAIKAAKDLCLSKSITNTPLEAVNE